MQYAFGKDITYLWLPFLDDKSVIDFPSQSPTIYVFGPDSRPSRAQARAGTGAIGSAISSWTSVAGGFQFSIPAIQDPDINSDTHSRTYYLGITYLLKAGGQTQTILETLELVRLFSRQAPIKCSIPDVLSGYSALSSYVTNDEIQQAITDATETVKAKFDAKGFEWARIKRIEGLSLMVKSRARMFLFAGQRVAGNETWKDAYEEEKDTYVTMLSNIRLEYDEDGDNAATDNEKETKARDSMAILER